MTFFLFDIFSYGRCGIYAHVDVIFLDLNLLFFYTVVGVILAVVGGKVLSIMKVERYLKKYDGVIRDFYAESEYFNQRQRLNYAFK